MKQYYLLATTFGFIALNGNLYATLSLTNDGLEEITINTSIPIQQGGSSDDSLKTKNILLKTQTVKVQKLTFGGELTLEDLHTIHKFTTQINGEPKEVEVKIGLEYCEPYVGIFGMEISVEGYQFIVKNVNLNTG